MMWGFMCSDVAVTVRLTGLKSSSQELSLGRVLKYFRGQLKLTVLDFLRPPELIGAGGFEGKRGNGYNGRCNEGGGKGWGEG